LNVPDKIDEKVAILAQAGKRKKRRNETVPNKHDKDAWEGLSNGGSRQPSAVSQNGIRKRTHFTRRARRANRIRLQLTERTHFPASVNKRKPLAALAERTQFLRRPSAHGSLSVPNSPVAWGVLWIAAHGTPSTLSVTTENGSSLKFGGGK
jgi:hypothetical protein